MCAGMLFYGLKQLELIGLVLFGQSTWCCPGLPFFSPIFAPKLPEPETKAKPNRRSQAGQEANHSTTQRGRDNQNRQSVRLSAWPSGKNDPKKWTQLRGSK